LTIGGFRIVSDTLVKSSMSVSSTPSRILVFNLFTG